jgi:hypothetical protein
VCRAGSGRMVPTFLEPEPHTRPNPLWPHCRNATPPRGPSPVQLQHEQQGYDDQPFETLRATEVGRGRGWLAFESRSRLRIVSGAPTGQADLSIQKILGQPVVLCH